jgi:hypothetical protein
MAAAAKDNLVKPFGQIGRAQARKLGRDFQEEEYEPTQKLKKHPIIFIN